MIIMKTLLPVLLILILGCNSQMDQKQMKIGNADQILIQDRLDLKELVDKFSILADNKDVENQLLLFTEDAVVESFRYGVSTSRLVGKDEIFNSFSSFLASLETVYHINGQQTVEISGYNAKGISYCLVILISDENGNKVKTTFGVSYNDEYVKEEGRWLIKKRKSYFNWEPREAI